MLAKPQVLKARDMVNVAAMLGMKSSYTVVWGVRRDRREGEVT